MSVIAPSSCMAPVKRCTDTRSHTNTQLECITGGRYGSHRPRWSHRRRRHHHQHRLCRTDGVVFMRWTSFLTNLSGVCSLKPAPSVSLLHLLDGSLYDGVCSAGPVIGRTAEMCLCEDNREQMCPARWVYVERACHWLTQSRCPLGRHLLPAPSRGRLTRRSR